MYIYLVKNLINGKRYVGQTSYSVSKRWAQHKRVARNGKNGSVLHHAIRKYGHDAFEIQTIFTCDNKRTLDLYERGHIRFFHARENGYNLTDGGDGTVGMIRTQEYRRKLSEALRGNKNCLGKKLSKEQRRKLSHQPHRKLTDEQVVEIRTLRAQGASLRELGSKYSVAISLISGICLGTRRKLVTDSAPAIENLKKISSDNMRKSAKLAYVEGRCSLRKKRMS